MSPIYKHPSVQYKKHSNASVQDKFVFGYDTRILHINLLFKKMKSRIHF